jgi:hypothetical protein
MDNLEDTWATAAIPKLTVISTDASLQLPTSNAPSCVWTLGGKKKSWTLLGSFRRPCCGCLQLFSYLGLSLTAARDIAKGESLTVAPNTGPALNRMG